MSTIERLSIQGIRSFGPNSEDCQAINFAPPVTLILGENGCGKTTIIECLKYALTGDLPPGSDRGKSFVHDPKIFGQNETLAQIKVQVRNKLGARLSVCRSMKVFHRGDKVTFESSEPTLNFLGGEDCNGIIDSISKRCGDTDVVMTEFMGVTKAIINNVLFCHQEDSSWPLDEPKKLKEKFDAIFGITEYNKAIERIIKMRKEKVDELKVMEANLKLLVHLKQEMENKSLNLKKFEIKCDAIRSKCANCDDEMKPIEARLLEIRKVELEIGKYQAQKVEIETKYKNCREQILNLDRKIKNKFEGSLSDLEMEIRLFDQKMSEKKLQLTEVKENLNRLLDNEGQQQKIVTDLEKKRCVTQQKCEMEQKCKQMHAQRIKELCGKLEVVLDNDSMATSSGVTDVLKVINLVLGDKKSEIAGLSKQCDVDDQNRQSEIDKIRVDLSKSEEGVLALQKQKSAYEKDNTALEAKISNIEVSMHQLKVVNQNIDDMNEKYERMLRNFDQKACRETIDSNKLNITNFQSQFHKVDEKLTFLNSIATLTAEIGLKERALEKKDQEVRRVKSKHSENFEKVFNLGCPTVNYRRALQVSYEKFRRDIKEFNEKANKEKLKQQSHEIKRKNFKDEIAHMEKELEESKEIVFQKCHSTPYEDLLARSKATVTKNQLEHGVLKSTENMYKKYIKKIHEDPCCPLCHKGMTTNEVADLNSELLEEIQKLPENIARSEKLLIAEQKKYENLLQLKPIIEKVNRLEIDLPKRKNELKSTEVSLAEASNEYESLQLLLAEPTLHMDLANSMLGDMSLLDEAIKESARLKNELDGLKKKLPDGHNDETSIEALQVEKNNLVKSLEKERGALEVNQQNYEKQKDGLNRMCETKNRLKEQQIKLQEGLQNLPQLKERNEELTQLLITTSLEINELQAKLKPLMLKLNEAITEKANHKDASRKKVSQLQKEYDAFLSSYQDIQRLNKEVNEYNELNLPAEVCNLNRLIKVAKKKLEDLSGQVAEMENQIEGIKTECLNQVTLERELKDNRELKHLQVKEIELNKQSETLNKQLGNMDFPSVAKEKNELVLKRDAATVRKGELLGQIGEINNQIEKLQHEIEDPKYKESIQNYRQGNFEAIVTHRIIDDLGQHRVALEWSLIQFHAEKMDKINRLIREYWRLIYRGNDIDYIEIQSKNDKEKDPSADRRRSYNYRVVQSKNNSEIEMRGRCSAGQRVLGSLIIRMALAETFSSNCGVLALDEPTTNLDRLNIVSLCDALNRIVEERQAQSNFMLIIITHDEEFISALGKIHFYHRVFRNDECKSVIRKVKVS